MSLLRDIQRLAVDGNSDIVSLLRNCRILATRLRHEGLKRWLASELEGYLDVASLPPYRIFNAVNQGEFSGLMGRRLQNAPIAVALLPKDFVEHFRKIQHTGSVASLSELLKRDDPIFVEYWNPNVFPFIPFGSIYEGMGLVQAWKMIPRSQIAGVLDAVRNKVLSFALEIEAENPEAGEALSTADVPIPISTVNQIFNNYITGNVGNIASGSPHSQQTAHISVGHNDFEILAAKFKEYGISPEDLASLREALESEPKPQGQSFGKKVSTWLGQMVAKAAGGVLNIGVSVASQLLTEALRSYYGLPPA